MTILLDKWDEDNDLAPLEPVVEEAGSTTTSFAHSTFGSRLGKADSGMVRWKRWKETFLFEGDGLVGKSESKLH